MPRLGSVIAGMVVAVVSATAPCYAAGGQRHGPVAVRGSLRAALVREAEHVIAFGSVGRFYDVQAVRTTERQAFNLTLGRGARFLPQRPVYLLTMRGTFFGCGCGGISAREPVRRVLALVVPASDPATGPAELVQRLDRYPDLRAAGSPFSLRGSGVTSVATEGDTTGWPSHPRVHLTSAPCDEPGQSAECPPPDEHVELARIRVYLRRAETLLLSMDATVENVPPRTEPFSFPVGTIGYAILVDGRYAAGRGVAVTATRVAEQSMQVPVRIPAGWHDVSVETLGAGYSSVQSGEVTIGRTSIFALSPP